MNIHYAIAIMKGAAHSTPVKEKEAGELLAKRVEEQWVEIANLRRIIVDLERIKGKWPILNSLEDVV